MAGIRGKSGPPGNQNAFRHGLSVSRSATLTARLIPTEQSIREEILAGLLADNGSKFKVVVLLRFRRDRGNYN